MELRKLPIDNTWTLFLDRDGVINEKIEDDYVHKWEDFRFLPGVLQSLNELSKIFGRIVIITNQRGIAKGLYTVDDLHAIHEKMLQEVRTSHGRVDGVFFCPHMGDEPECNCRKPKPGMAFQARTAFPEIVFTRSIVAGDSLSDLLFGERLGMKTVHISSSKPIANADYHFHSLQDFTRELSHLSH